METSREETAWVEKCPCRFWVLGRQVVTHAPSKSTGFLSSYSRTLYGDPNGSDSDEKTVFYFKYVLIPLCSCMCSFASPSFSSFSFSSSSSAFLTAA